jgi:hypothetical protein
VEGVKMNSVEDKETRFEMVDMHQFFIDKIEVAICEKRYIEASWLIYSCMENRFFRVLCKYKNQCDYCKGKCKKDNNELSIRTKIACVKRLCESGVSCISESFSIGQLDEISNWINQRNKMMHDLLCLDTYKKTDEKFKSSALEGKALLDGLYKSCTEFRKLYFDSEYIFEFPKEVMCKCACAKIRNK